MLSNISWGKSLLIQYILQIVIFQITYSYNFRRRYEAGLTGMNPLPRRRNSGISRLGEKTY
jgi:hypothetical protein